MSPTRYVWIVLTLLSFGAPAAADSGRFFYVRTVPPITDPASPSWGKQASGGDGSVESPFGSVAELMDQVVLLPRDTIEIDSYTSGIPNYGAIYIEGVPAVRIRTWDLGAGKSRLICGKPIDIRLPHLIGGTYDVYRTVDGALPELPNRISQNWNTNRNHIGQRYGILDAKDSPEACADDYGFFFDELTGVLYVSVPSGQDVFDYEHIVGDPGHGILIFDCPDAVVENLIVEHAFSEFGTEGYGIRFDGRSPRCQALNNVTDGCRWHSIGTVANDPRGTKIRGNHCRTAIPGNDTHLIIYVAAEGGQVVDCEITDNLIELDPWLGWDGQPFIDVPLGVKGIGCHTVDGAIDSPPGGLVIARNTTVWAGHYSDRRNTDLTFVAFNNRLGGRPADIHDHASYPVQLHDNVWGGHGMTVGGGFNSRIWVSSERDHWNLNAADIVEPIGTSGLIGCIEGVNSDNGLRIGASTISGVTTKDHYSKSLLAVGRGGDLILDGVSVHMRGLGYAPSARLISFSAEAESFHASGSIFSSEQEGIRLSTGSWIGTMPDALAEAQAWDLNWYAPSLHTTFNSSAGRRRADFRSDIDPQGEFDVAPLYVDAQHLEPDEATRSNKNLARVSGLRGVNDKPYDQTYGAWQFGIDCIADQNGDGSLDFFDVSLFMIAFSNSEIHVDFNNDGHLNFFDVSLFLAAYSSGCP